MRTGALYLRRMRGLPPSRLAALAAACLSLALGGCGGEEKGRPLPARAANAIVTDLDQLQQRVDDGECADVKKGNIPRIQKQIDRLPDDVDEDVRTTLEDGFDRLKQLVDEQCEQKQEPKPVEPAPEPDPTQPEPTQPEPTEPEPTLPEPKPEKPKEDKPKEEEPGGGAGDGGGTAPGAGGEQPKVTTG